MKRLLFIGIIAIFSLSLSVQAQNNVGIGTTTPQASALLDLTATNMGLLIPRVTLLAVGNGTSPVNAPATGLLVYNTGGALTAGFYYWDGAQWVQVGAGGGGCTTLDEAYDCGGAGAGYLITADAGSVQIDVAASSSSTEALYLTVANGSSATPTVGLASTHSSAYGGGVYSENTNTANMYSAIQGIHLSSNSNASSFPTAISGYFDGTGIGAGVWGENISNSSAGLGAGIYGNGIGTNVFGGWFYGQSSPGINVETGQNTYAAAQIIASGINPLNPGLQAVGSSQFDCSNSTATSIILNNLGTEPTAAPSNGGWGYVGTAGVSWYYVYGQNVVATSRRETKRDITYLDNSTYDLVMEDIDNIKPAFYKFKNETDEIEEGNESKARYNMHMGLILDEAPDYLQDNSFSGIDIYALATLSLAGVKHLKTDIDEIKELVAINDFGMGQITNNEVYISYNASFTSKMNTNETPIVNITPTSPGAQYYIKSQDKNGFVLVSENGAMSFNWTAMAHMNNEQKNNEQVNQTLMDQLRVPQAKKDHIHNLLFNDDKQQTLELKGNADASKNKSLRYQPDSE
ncbi:MAG: hypothetical protein JXR53_12625 [Bacteroidales bacterium]|nr:hypothetical protein [Bacteroidales bacterium]